MTESFAVGASLQWRSNVPEVLQQMVAAFGQVNRLVADTKTGLGALAESLRGLNGKGVASLVQNLEKLKIPDAALDGLRDMKSLTRDLAEAQTNMAREATATVRAYREMAEQAARVKVPRPPGGSGGGSQPGGGGHGPHTSAMDAAMGAQLAGDAGMGLLVRGYNAYADVQINQQLAQSDKALTDAVMGRANKLIAALQKQYPAMTQSEGITLFRNSMGIFGDADEAMKALPGAARLEMLYKLAPIGRGGTGGSEVQAAEKAGDIMGSFVNQKGGIDLGLYQRFMDFQARSYQAGGGLVDAKNWLAFARTSRTAGMGLSDRAMEEAQALLEISPSRTGTALNSAFQVFGASTRHMTKQNRFAWEKAGLLKPDGNIIDQKLYQTDPFAWVWSDLLPALAKHGVTTRDQILRWLTDNGQRGTVAGLLADIAVDKSQITRTADKMGRQDPNLVDKLMNSDAGKLAALHAAETNFFVALGKFGEGPGLALLSNLTSALNKLTDWANAHPETATRLIEIGGGLSLISKVAGDTAMAAIFVGAPLIKGLGSLASSLVAFRAGGAAETALATLAAGSGVGSLAGFGLAIVALAATMAGLRWATSPPDGTRFVGSGRPGVAGHFEKQGPDGNWAPSAPPKSMFEDWWDHFRDAPVAPPGTNARRGRASAASAADNNAVPVTIVNQGAPQPITITATHHIHLDGKVIAKIVDKHFAESLMTQKGITGFDMREHALPQLFIP